MVFWSAISLGLVSSLHCLGMCGPLVLAIPGQGTTKGQALMTALEYNLGRITTYVLLGLFFGLLGQGLLMSETQQFVAISLGVLLLLSSIWGFKLDQYLNRWPLMAKVNQKIRSAFQYLLVRQQRHFFFGLLNGVLPCGMVYLALAGAMTTEHIWQGAAFMFSFGLGTLPAMVAPFFVGHGIRNHLRPYLPYLQTTAVVVMGVFLIIRGLQVAFPEELNFLEMLKHPIMCH